MRVFDIGGHEISGWNNVIILLIELFPSPMNIFWIVIGNIK